MVSRYAVLHLGWYVVYNYAGQYVGLGLYYMLTHQENSSTSVEQAECRLFRCTAPADTSSECKLSNLRQ